jgi:flagellin
MDALRNKQNTWRYFSMGMVVRTNTMSANAYRQLGMNNTAVAKSLEKLSSGYRINRAGDDASGLAISEKMKAQISGLEQASANSQDGISLVQTAEGALTEVHSMLNRMVSLATKSASGTIQNQVDRDSIQTEVDALKSEISRVSKSTNFNGINLLDGSLGAGAPDASANIAGQAISAKKTDAVAFSASLTVDANDVDIALNFKDKDGNAVTLSAAGCAQGDAADMLADLKTADADKYAKLTEAYDVTAGTGTITFKAKTAGANGSVQAGTGLSGAASAGAIAGATAGADAKSEITINANMTAGDIVKIGGKTYTMAAATDAEKGTFADITGLKALATADGYTVTGSPDDLQSGSKLTITANEGTAAGGLTLQVGDTNADYNKVTVSVDDMSAKGLGIDKLDVSSQKAAGDAIQTIKDAINKVSTNRGNMGALQNRLDYAINNLDTTAENMTSANSRIRDTDMAKEMMQYTKMNILTQAAQAMLAQANQNPQSILQLLQ